MPVKPTPEQIEESFVFEAWMVHGVDLNDLDEFFAKAEMLEKHRQGALEDRRRASAAYAKGNDLERAMDIVRVLLMVRQNYQHLVPLAKAGKAYSKRQRDNAASPRKFGEEQRKRIAREYWRRVAEDGTRYGVAKAMAGKHDTTTATIRAIAKEHPPNSIEQ